MIEWLHGLGVVLAIVLLPGAGISPFIYWIVTGIFPMQYFLFWLAGILGGTVFGVLESFDPD